MAVMRSAAVELLVLSCHRNNDLNLNRLSLREYKSEVLKTFQAYFLCPSLTVQKKAKLFSKLGFNILLQNRISQRKFCKHVQSVESFSDSISSWYTNTPLYITAKCKPSL